MKLHTKKIADVAKEFATTSVLPNAPTDLARFGVGFMIPYLGTSVQNMITQYAPMAKTIGIIDGNDYIDVENAYSAAVSALEKAGGKMTVFGLILSRNDLDALREIANRHAN